VQAADIALVRVPAALVPEGALTTPDAAIGRSAVVELPIRSLVTPSVLIGAGGSVPNGRVALPVRFGEAGTVSLLHVGDHIDVIGPTDGSDYGIVAADVRVMAIPAGGTSGLLNDSASALVLVEVNRTEASEIAAAAAISSLSYALH
jgi:Flp pilus assembly protein CpaB